MSERASDCDAWCGVVRLIDQLSHNKHCCCIVVIMSASVSRMARLWSQKQGNSRASEGRGIEEESLPSEAIEVCAPSLVCFDHADVVVVIIGSSILVDLQHHECCSS